MNRWQVTAEVRLDVKADNLTEAKASFAEFLANADGADGVTVKIVGMDVVCITKETD